MVQSFPHTPQLRGSVLTSVQVLPHIIAPAPHEHMPHAHAELHVSVPLPGHGCVAFTMHAPSPVQAAHADQAPAVQVRDCMPQLPHDCDVDPTHRHWPLWQIAPVGHECEHVPQLDESSCRSMLHAPVDEPPQCAYPLVPQSIAHWLPEQIAVPWSAGSAGQA